MSKLVFVFDTETTGLPNQEIIKIAMILKTQD